jgi:hypothetical protein
MGHWSSSKYSTDYEDEDDEEVNQPMLSPVHEEYPLPVEEPAKDDREPTDDEEEVPPAAEVEEEEKKEKEAPVEVVDNITETILPRFAPMPCYKKHKLNPQSPNMIMEDEDDSSLD